METVSGKDFRGVDGHVRNRGVDFSSRTHCNGGQNGEIGERLRKDDVVRASSQVLKMAMDWASLLLLLPVVIFDFSVLEDSRQHLFGFLICEKSC